MHAHSRFVINTAQTCTHAHAHAGEYERMMRDEWDGEFGDRRQELVFIGAGMKEELIQSVPLACLSLQLCLVLDCAHCWFFGLSRHYSSRVRLPMMCLPKGARGSRARSTLPMHASYARFLAFGTSAYVGHMHTCWSGRSLMSASSRTQNWRSSARSSRRSLR
jgi:hypothetical protein